MNHKELLNKIGQLEEKIEKMESSRTLSGFLSRLFNRTSVVIGVVIIALLGGVVLYATQTIFTDGTVISAEQVNSNFTELYNTSAPVGTILAWHKSMAGTPALSDCWVECNGQTISDADSPYNGSSVPDLNSGLRFLQGNTTSGTETTKGGHSHSINPPSTSTSASGSHSHGGVSTGGGNTFSAGNHLHTVDIASFPSSSGGNVIPAFDVVWIIRIK